MSLLGIAPTLFGTPVLDRTTGLMTRPWQQFFQALYTRVGQENALTQHELDAAIVVHATPTPTMPVDDTASGAETLFQDSVATVSSLEQRVALLEVLMSTVLT